MRTFAALAICALLQLAISASQQRSVSIPANALLLTQQTPLEFVAYLAKVRVPCGIEVNLADMAPPRPSPSAELGDKKGITPQEVVKAFNAMHTAYTMQLLWMELS
jgi:hypothetical protein